MRLINPNFEHVFEIKEGNHFLVVIENPEIMRTYISDLIKQANGEDGPFVLSENNSELDISKNMDILSNVLVFETVDKSVTSKVNSLLKSFMAGENMFERTAILKTQIENYAIQLSEEFVNNSINSMHKLPSQYKKELLEKGLDSKQADILLASKELVDYFDDVSSLGVKDIKVLYNYLMVDILAYLNKQLIGEQSVSTLKFSRVDLKDFINLICEGKINSKQAKQVLEIMYKEGKSPLDIVKQLGLEQVSDVSQIEKIVDEVLANNQQSISDYKAGHDRALGYIVGQVMKASKGKANPSIAKELILKKLG